MQVTVPQFIDVESKIIGPISARQFIILMVGFMIEYLVYNFGTVLSLLMFTPFVLGTAVMFAFVKINGQYFHIFVLNFAITMKRPKLRLWERQIDVIVHRGVGKPKAPFIPKTGPTRSRLRELSLIVDTGGAYELDRQHSS